eukprot:1775939-Rhodomonas_salina.1
MQEKHALAHYQYTLAHYRYSRTIPELTTDTVAPYLRSLLTIPSHTTDLPAAPSVLAAPYGISLPRA